MNFVNITYIDVYCINFHQVEIAGYKVEQGANWIHFAHDEETAPIWQKKLKNNIHGFFSNYSSFIIRFVARIVCTP